MLFSFKKFLVSVMVICSLAFLCSCKTKISIDTVDISDVEDGRVYQKINYQVLTYKGNELVQTALDVLNNDMKKSAEEFKTQNKDGIREFIQEHTDMAEEAMYSHTVDIDIKRNDDKYLSITEYVYENMMGAHGNYVLNGHTYDIKEGKELGIYDFVSDKEELRKFLKDWVSDKNEQIGFFDDVMDTIDSYIDGRYEIQFYITKKLNIVFQPYDIAPYAAGLIEVEVDDKLLKVK